MKKIVPIINQILNQEPPQLLVEKGLETALAHGRLLLIIFVACIGGLIALALAENLSAWSGFWFLLADGFAIMGLGCCLFQMWTISQVFLLIAALLAEPEDESRMERLLEIAGDMPGQLRSVHSLHSLQLMFLFFVGLTSSLGLAGMLWRHTSLAGIVIVCVIFGSILLLMSAALISAVIDVRRANRSRE